VTRERITGAAVLAVLVAIGVWVAFNTYWADVTVSTPFQGEAKTNRYYSLEHLLHTLGMRTQRVASLRSLPPGHDVLLMTELTNDEAHGRMEEIEHWVQGGGRLVVTTNTVWSSPPLQKWSGIAPSHRDPKSCPAPQASPASAPATPSTSAAPVTPTKPCASAASATSAPPTTPTAQSPSIPAPPTPVRTLPPIHPASDSGCAPLTVEIGGAATGAELRICQPKTEFSFVSKRRPTWSLSNDIGLQMLRVDIGRGSLTVAGQPFLLLNREFEGAQLEKGGRLLIFTPSRAEPLMAMLWRVAASAIVCFGVAVVLLILRNLPLFGPREPEPVAARRSLAEQLRANAKFAWRTGNIKSLRRAVLRALERSAAQHIAGYGSLTARRRAIELGKRAGVDPSLLNSAMTEDAAGTPSVQRAAIALLEQTRRALTHSHPPQGALHDR
jgi:hypothetical protein